MTTTTETTERERILDALERWINQRPGLQFANYGKLRAYRQEQASIARDKKQAILLLRAVKWRETITAEHLKEAFKSAYSGRLSWNGEGFEYCTGQYWPTEYRRAACAVLASALWQSVREMYNDQERPGEKIRAYFRREFGNTIGRRWFD